MTLQQRLSLSIFSVLLLFCVNVAIYFWGSYIRTEGLVVLRDAVANQKVSAELKQRVQDQQKAILILDALKLTGEKQLSEDEISESLQSVRELHQALLQLLGKTLTTSTTLPADEITEDIDNLISSWRNF